MSGWKEDSDCLDSNVLFDKIPYLKKKQKPQLKFGFNMNFLK